MALILSKATFSPNEDITGTTDGAGTLVISKLATEYLSISIDENFNLGPLPPGSYAVSHVADGGVIESTALEVIANPFTRVRYGFISEFSADVDTAQYTQWSRRLHLSAIQFYDWAWKHEFLVSNEENYGDPLGAQISRSKIKELIGEYEKVGTLAAGYVAVYAVNSDGWERWQKSGLFNEDGEPYKLGEDFLWIVDPADKDWLPHLTQQLKHAYEFGFRAFHLDQYGWPKIAYKHDRSIVNLAEQFPIMLNQIANELSEATLIFNNVNDFPTWSTSQAHQNAIYIEVWSPHDTYGDLANLVSKSRLYNPDLPIILSAYLNPFKEVTSRLSIDSARASLALAFAAISSGGASHLITGGNGRVLHDPYYVKNYLADEGTLRDLENYFNFLVSSGDLLYDESRIDITMTSVFGINGEIRFESEAILSHDARAGTLWVRVFRGEMGLTIHFINLMDQTDALWDSPKNPLFSTANVSINIDKVGNSTNAHIGYSAIGSQYENLEGKCHKERLAYKVQIHGPWTIVNIPTSTI